MLLLSREDVEALLDLDALIDALADAMANLSAGRASVPNRVAAFVPERDGLLAAMPAYDPANAALTTKLVSLFPRNAGTALPTHVVCATTHADEPVIRRDWLSPGTHVASVGYNPPGREVDDATVADAYVVVESRAAALAPAPSGSSDLTEPISNGIIGADHVKAEIGELILGTQPGRSSDTEITLYKSVGVAVQDAAAAAQVLAAARSAGVGQEVAIS